MIGASARTKEAQREERLSLCPPPTFLGGLSLCVSSDDAVEKALQLRERTCTDLRLFLVEASRRLFLQTAAIRSIRALHFDRLLILEKKEKEEEKSYSLDAITKRNKLKTDKRKDRRKKRTDHKRKEETSRRHRFCSASSSSCSTAILRHLPSSPRSNPPTDAPLLLTNTGRTPTRRCLYTQTYTSTHVYIYAALSHIHARIPCITYTRMHLHRHAHALYYRCVGLGNGREKAEDKKERKQDKQLLCLGSSFLRSVSKFDATETKRKNQTERCLSLPWYGELYLPSVWRT